MISYRVEPDDLHTHHYRVTLRVPRPAATVGLALPVWIPGSYMVRDFARHLSDLQAWQGDQPCAVQVLGKSSWQVQCQGNQTLVLHWRVYAFDKSVRGAFLDDQRGFFNGSSLLLQVQGRSQQPHRLQLGRLPTGWQVATAMSPGRGRLTWLAESYDALIDHPFELGKFWHGQFEAGGVPHELVVSGAWPRFDSARLLADARRVCQAVLDFWQEDAPFERYVLLLHVADEGYGGLEHRASTALLANRRDLPVAGTAPSGEGYCSLLGLIGHEYFHAWNVVRMKPAELAQPDYSRENHSQLLWFFEGFTTYYEDLLMRRAGLLDAARYLRTLARLVNAVQAMPGRQVQSLAEASFDAWTKYYRIDENTPNATVSYYSKGALLGLALDLSLRCLGHSLDALMRQLWRASQGGPISEADVLAGVQALTESGCQAGQVTQLQAQLRAWVHGRGELPLAPLLAECGVVWRTEPANLASRLGLKLSEGPLTGVQVRQVLAGGAAAAAGLAAGDELLAVDGWRIRRLDEALAWTVQDQPMTLLLVRDQRLLERQILPPAAGGGQVQLLLQESPTPEALARRQAWLNA